MFMCSYQLLKKCLTCGEEMDIDELPLHLEVCAAVNEKLVPDKIVLSLIDCLLLAVLKLI